MRHLTTGELAEREHVTRGTVRRWRLSGEGPRHWLTPGGQARYPLDAVEAWERDRMSGGGSAA